MKIFAVGTWLVMAVSKYPLSSYSSGTNCIGLLITSSDLPQPTSVHEVWQSDSQDDLRLADGTVATICNIRDPVEAA
jgi:hypothetical protein